MKEADAQPVLVHDEFLGAACVKSAAGGFFLGHWIVDQCGDEVKAHGHQEAHFVFVTSGHYITTATGETARGHLPLVYNPPHTFHRDRFEVGPGSFFTVSISAALMDEASELALPQMPTQIGRAIPHAVVSKLMQECAQCQSDSALLIESLCFELMGAVAAPTSEQCAPTWLKRACDMLQDDYAQAMAIKDLSRTVGVHPIHLTRTFRAFYRCTPGEFLRARRLQRAAELLTSTRLSLIEVALESGFADQSHLTKHFRRTYGVPPGQYRRLTTRHTISR